MPNTQDTLAGLRRWKLERDDTSDPGGRIYRDINGNVYHSVTRILKETSDTTGLERWAARLGEAEATCQRNVAANRGNMAHNQAEYLLKTAQQLARSTANKRNSIRWDEQGLARIPAPITTWALKRVRPHVPPVGFSAKGYARGLSDWIADNVTEIFASEFSIHHPAGFAGTADALLTVKGKQGIHVVDWKTSVGRKTDRDDRLPSNHSYIDQCGAYSLGLTYLTGLKAAGAIIVLARRCGAPNVHYMNSEELEAAECSYLARCHSYFEQLHSSLTNPIHVA